MPHESLKRILVVDDNPDNVELLEAFLEHEGYIVESATDGQQALTHTYEDPPDLILLDIMMPKVNGIEVVRQLKNDPKLPFIPVILQTALQSTDDLVRGLDAGADDYIVKPLNFRELQARMRSLLRIKALQNDLAERERQLSEANDRLMEMAQTDVLTGVANRRHLTERLQDMWKHAQRMHEPLSVAMCDIDHFKQVNDEYGHQVGDTILTQVAALLTSMSRDIDVAGRFGGEEFLILLPGADTDAAVAVAERVRQGVEQHTFPYPGGTLRRTISCGVATWPHPRITHQDALIKAADDALYVAKETGRNRVVQFDSQRFNEHLATAQGSENSERQIGERHNDV